MLLLLLDPALASQDTPVEPGPRFQQQFWTQLKAPMLVEGGREYFESNVKGSLLPPPDLPPFLAWVITAVPRSRPKVLMLGISDRQTVEVRLRFKQRTTWSDTSVNRRVERGSQIEFRGVGAELELDPFLLTFDAAVEWVRFVSKPGAKPRRK
jgi:hypothetical protein